MVTRVPINCPQCGRTLRVREEYVGRKGECRYCHNRFRMMPSEVEPLSEPPSEPPKGLSESEMAALQATFVDEDLTSAFEKFQEDLSAEPMTRLVTAGTSRPSFPPPVPPMLAVA